MNFLPVQSSLPPYAIDGNEQEPNWLCYSWISFEKFLSSQWCCGFAYDWVTDEDISKAAPASTVELAQDWQDVWEEDGNNTWQEFHAARIKGLVNLLCDGTGVKPVDLDLLNDSLSSIPDGHHRIRAFQFLKSPVFPAYAQGLTDEIDKVLYRE